VKLTFDKNDMSDLAPYGAMAGSLLSKCTDTPNYSTTLVPNSFLVDEPNDYMEWAVSITMPPNMSDPDCLTAYGAELKLAQAVGRQSVTVTLKYSMVRMNPAPTYQPLLLGEKDPIRHKYGPIQSIFFNRDPQSGQVAAQEFVNRFDPMKPLVWYLAQGYPAEFQTFYTCQGSVAAACKAQGITEADTIEGQTNQLLADAKAVTRLTFLNYNDAKTFGDGAGPNRQYGDIRYNFIRYVSDSPNSSSTPARARRSALPSPSSTSACRTSMRSASTRTCRASAPASTSTPPGNGCRRRARAPWAKRCRSSPRPSCRTTTATTRSTA
jgi:hypothetical protein